MRLLMKVDGDGVVYECFDCEVGQGYATLLSGRGCGTAGHSVMVSSEVVGETYSSTVGPVRLMINEDVAGSRMIGGS